jgi:radical SAM superfamily enzyme YgiQ (UPF0313 family)
MSDYTKAIRNNLHRFKTVAPYLPGDNPSFHNPSFDDASYRVLIARLSPFRDVDRSLPHLTLFQETRRALPQAYIDLAFFPDEVARALFDELEIPHLLGVQSLQSADAFDLVLISNAYTLELINLPYLLLHSSIPLYAGQRGPEWPILLLGGSNALAAQAIVRPDGDSLVDGLFFGEGEGQVSQIVSMLARARDRGGDARAALAEAAREATGLWAAGTPETTTKAVLYTPEAHLLPIEYPLLNGPEAHTAHLQINYGCPAFCSFCFEGYDRRPYREIPLPDLLATARQIKSAQGVEELNLYSFNFNTHRDILALLPELHRLFERVSMMSQRADILQHAAYLLEAEVEADKRSYTLGIEGISERQRAFLHKSLPTADILRLLERLLGHKVREIKLFYLLTGHESEEDIAEFRQFLRQLKGKRRPSSRGRNRGVRVIFSFGLLIRMPFTPLRYDRLMLDEAAWRPLIGQVKSACETNRFEFRLAFDWPTYCTTQVLALGGHWLSEPLVDLAQKGTCYDTDLPPGYWDALRAWMVREGHWNDAFLGEKGHDYPFALAFVRSDVSPAFLYRQYEQAKEGVDSGYCLGGHDGRGRCLGCGACVDEEQRDAITRHKVRIPDARTYLARLREVMTRKRHLRATYYLLRLDPSLAGVHPAFLNASVFKGLLARYPELTENLLSVRESLFTVRPNDRRFPAMNGETVFALKAWDAEALGQLLAEPHEGANSGFEVVGPVGGFTPGAYERLHLDVYLPAAAFSQPRRTLERYLRDVYLPYSLRREGKRYRFEVPKKGLKKKVVLGGTFESDESGFYASLEVGVKFDLMAFLGMFGRRNGYRYAKVSVAGITFKVER